MQIHVISLFPEMITQASSIGVLGRAIEAGKLTLRCWNPRDFTHDRHRTVDDRPYGGGPGMLMKVQPLADAIAAATAESKAARVIYLSPQGEPLKQAKVQALSQQPEDLILIAGRYEGIDERLIDELVDEEISIGDYVLSGGELPALVLIDAITRMLPGVLGDDDSAQQDSFMHGILDHPHYTRPEQNNGRDVPAVLLGGDHKAIARWRLKQALGRTWLRRPELIEAAQLDAEKQALLDEFITEHQQNTID
jgi:tRNA (guanine37-N1)-methyltransferase